MGSMGDPSVPVQKKTKKKQHTHLKSWADGLSISLSLHLFGLTAYRKVWSLFSTTTRSFLLEFLCFLTSVPLPSYLGSIFSLQDSGETSPAGALALAPFLIVNIIDASYTTAELPSSRDPILTPTPTPTPPHTQCSKCLWILLLA